jgi:hypothetical protein
MPKIPEEGTSHIPLKITCYWQNLGTNYVLVVDINTVYNSACITVESGLRDCRHVFCFEETQYLSAKTAIE